MYNEGFEAGIKKNQGRTLIARKIYLTYPTFAFNNNYEIQFQLLDTIASEFGIPITNIQIAGSAKTGFSYAKNKEFKMGESDLDIAIIDPFLFQTYCEIVTRVTRGFKDLSKFSAKDDFNSYQSYIEYLAKGMFRPDLMPYCDEKRNWFNFFNKLSSNYLDLFSNINAGIYFSQLFFEYKQSDNVYHFKKL